MRLIDADKLRKYIMGYASKPTYTQALYLKAIDEQPTAYDIDKVFEELEDYKNRLCDEDRGYITNEIEKAIEIVKQGGVSDDVCEWKCDEYGRWHTECHYLADNDPLEYRYCPYCGKKIKEVE